MHELQYCDDLENCGWIKWVDSEPIGLMVNYIAHLQNRVSDLEAELKKSNKEDDEDLVISIADDDE